MAETYEDRSQRVHKQLQDIAAKSGMTERDLTSLTLSVLANDEKVLEGIGKIRKREGENKQLELVNAQMELTRIETNLRMFELGREMDRMNRKIRRSNRVQKVKSWFRKKPAATEPAKGETLHAVK